MLLGVLPGIVGIFVGAWLPRAVAGFLDEGWSAVWRVSVLSQPPDVPKYLQYLQMVGAAAISIPAFVIGPKVWRRLVLKWGIATAEQIEDYERHVK
jgi:hypothetical protein